MELIYIKNLKYQLYVDIYNKPKHKNKEDVKKDVLDVLVTILSWRKYELYKGYIVAIDKIKQ